MNGLTLLVLIALAAGGFLLFRLGVRHGERQGYGSKPLAEPLVRPASAPEASPAAMDSVGADQAPVDVAVAPNAIADASNDEHARLVRTLAVETFALRREVASIGGQATQLGELAEDRHRLLRELADARSATARYRQLVIDLENDAPPPLLTNAHAIDDLKLVVGIGPMLERMLQQLGITTYRQIARWSERDIAEFDAKLPEFPGRIRRDEWVKQARALHQSKYGEILSARG